MYDYGLRANGLPHYADGLLPPTSANTQSQSGRVYINGMMIRTLITEVDAQSQVLETL